MAATLLSKFKQEIGRMTLVPASGGCFELTVDGGLIYSKLETGAFPDEQTIIEQLASR